MWGRPTILTIALLLVGGVQSSSASAAAVSSNWAGYVVKGRGAHTRFERIVGAWTQPQATCARGRRTYSAFWVGLGGYARNSSKLEQAGTEADCDAAGTAHYAAWYELLPQAPATLRLTVAPGDTIAASVTVSGDRVTIHVRDLTSGRSVARRLTLSAPDTSTAEWIAEAPSSCSSSGCVTLPLTDFGAVTFYGSSATAASGEAGTISDPAWSTIPIEIQGDLEAVSAASGPSFAGAKPGELSEGGASFSVTWLKTEPATPPSIGPPPGFV